MKAKTENQKPQIISDYRMMLFKLINRPKMRDDEKIKKLDELATKFRNGWPFGEQNTLAGYGAKDGFKNDLERLASTLSEQIRKMMLVREGRDLGKFDRTELDSNHVYGSKKQSAREAKKSAQTKAVEIVKKTQDED